MAGSVAIADCAAAASMYLLTLRIIPKKIQLNNIEVPPHETIGSVRPPTGTRCTEMAMFASACITIFKLNPMATIAPKDFSLIVTSLVTRKNNMT